ncbi:odorant receptor 46a-like [Tenebrio molitor]|uniref:odorant receptor 46a-like n=1 Tax=Tenebrio molitor TaxID=7067 RepID=UPI0036248941
MITNILATVKMYTFVVNMRVIKELLLVLDSFHFQPKSLEQVKLVQPTLQIWKKLYIVYSSVVGVNVLLWSIAPLLNEGQRLPFVAWYPFSTESSPNYQIIYIYQVVCIWYITIANLNLDCMTYALMMYICAQCDILCDNLSLLGGTETDFSTTLRECIAHHTKIVHFAKEGNRVFNMIILGQFATSTLVLALTMFQLTLVDPISEAAVTHVCYLLGISMQILLYCWFGNEVEIKSSQIPYAIYKCDWFGRSVGANTSLLILSVRCQEPIRITAINLFALSLKTFVAILRMAWSYFAVLYKVNNQ